MTPATRRQFLRRSGLGFGSAALAMLLADDAPAADRADPLAPKKPHHAPTAKRVIYLHMIGAPSHLDLFDHKPELQKRDGQACPEELLKGRRFAFIGGKMTLAGSPFTFAKHGKSGLELSELLPHLATVADELAVVRTVHTEEINHAPAQLFLHTGFGRGGRPGFGSWVAYGLGSEARDLPAYVVLLSGPLGGAGTALWGSGFLPGAYQGVQFRTAGDPVLHLGNPPGQSAEDRRRILDATRKLNEEQLDAAGDPEIATRVAQYELAFKMQASVPDLMDLSKEPREVLEAYGATPGKGSFANNCLLARRLVERGARVVELYDADWDHHNNVATRLPAKCKDVDRGAAALVKDLKRLGMLDDTLVVWGSEFGRTPLRQGADGDGKPTNPGRDHHKDAFTCWLAGGGVKGGTVLGATDPFGFSPAESPVHVHDLNATVLHLLGLDHERLTFKYQGREFRLTDVHGAVQKPLLR
ncbi:MAG: sulfatase [Isosphaera sp.]|nr:sulfatase [Isosphaera sp.]